MPKSNQPFDLANQTRIMERYGRRGDIVPTYLLRKWSCMNLRHIVSALDVFKIIFKYYLFKSLGQLNIYFKQNKCFILSTLIYLRTLCGRCQAKHLINISAQRNMKCMENIQTKGTTYEDSFNQI